MIFNGLDLFSRANNIDKDVLSISEKFIDSIIGDYKEPYFKPKFKKQNKPKEVKLKSYEEKPYLINYYGKTHIYKHIEDTIHEIAKDKNYLTARELIIRLKVIGNVSLFDSKRYSLYVMASNEKYFKLYTGEDTANKIMFPIPRRSGMIGFSFKTLFSYSAYVAMVKFDAILQRKYLMLLNRRRVNKR